MGSSIGNFFGSLVKKKDQPKEDFWEPPIGLLEDKMGASGVISEKEKKSILIEEFKVDKSFHDDELDADEEHEGLMKKRCPSLGMLWQQRYFVLKHRMLRYYKTEGDYTMGKPPKGILNF